MTSDGSKPPAFPIRGEKSLSNLMNPGAYDIPSEALHQTAKPLVAGGEKCLQRRAALFGAVGDSAAVRRSSALEYLLED